MTPREQTVIADYRRLKSFVKVGKLHNTTEWTIRKLVTAVAPELRRPKGHEIRDIAGQHIGHWTVLSVVGKKKGRTLWLCRCDCGSEKAMPANVMKPRQTVCRCGTKRGRPVQPVKSDLQGWPEGIHFTDAKVPKSIGFRHPQAEQTESYCGNSSMCCDLAAF